MNNTLSKDEQILLLEILLTVKDGFPLTKSESEFLKSLGSRASK